MGHQTTSPIQTPKTLPSLLTITLMRAAEALPNFGLQQSPVSATVAARSRLFAVSPRVLTFVRHVRRKVSQSKRQTVLRVACLCGPGDVLL